MNGLPAPAFAVPGAMHALPLGTLGGIHVLMSLDAVGGVWRYAMDLAATMAVSGHHFTFAGFGPPPSPAQRAEAERLGTLAWIDAPLDWLTGSEAPLDAIPGLLAGLVDEVEPDLVHLNLPSQAAGLSLDVPVLVVSHSCVVTWFAAVRGSGVPADWLWQERRNRAGFAAASAVVAPSHAHAAMLRTSYGALEGLTVVHNGAERRPGASAKEPFVFAAGRWWDDGKNAALLDAAAGRTRWPVRMAGACDGPNGQRRDLQHAEALGSLGHHAVVEEMRRAAIVASPSIYEPFGLVPLEAANAGAAMVLSDIATYRELWDGAALFADPHDVEDFAAAIDRLADDEALRAELGRAAFERAGRYTLEAQAREMAALYEQLLVPTPNIARTA